MTHSFRLSIYLQSWTKVLGTVLQYSYFSVTSRFPLKTVHHFRNSLAVLPSPPYTKLKLGKKFWIQASNIVCGVRGGGDLCELENAQEAQKCPKTFVHDCRFYLFLRFLSEDTSVLLFIQK